MKKCRFRTDPLRSKIFGPEHKRTIIKLIELPAKERTMLSPIYKPTLMVYDIIAEQALAALDAGDPERCCEYMYLAGRVRGKLPEPLQ